ncbi:MAG: hemolysin family protein [Clostridiales bacterium]|nr:hemolysin family protein [Clostridiales bacterium]
MLQSIILLIVLIFLNAVFASAELAVLSMNEAKLRKLTQDGDKRAKKLTALVEQPARFLATIQVAITLAGLLQSAFAAESFANPLAYWLISLGVTVPASVLKPFIIVVITLILSYFTLVFGELVPKRIAMKKSDALALAMAGMLYGVAKIFAPIVWLLTISTNGILRILGMNPEEEQEQVTEEEIRMLLTESKEQGNIQEEEKEMIQNIFEFNDISIDEICTHRRDIILLHMDDEEEEWIQTIRNNRHTFYPICGATTDEIVAVLDTKDFFRLEDQSRDNLMANATDKPFFVPETMRANVLFKQMKQNRVYFAVIIDEYGSMTGIITLHDLVESLVGELNDEDDPIDPPEIEQIGENQWHILGTALIRDVETTLALELAEDDYDTFSGYICTLIGRIPQDGEQFSCETDELMIDIHGVTKHMITTTLVTRKKKPEAET